MSTELREAYRTAAPDVPVLGDVEAAVRAGRRRRLGTRVGGPVAVAVAVVAAVLVIPALVPESSTPDGAPASDGPGESVVGEDLAGRTFVSTGPVEGLPRAFQPSLTFDGTQLRASSGCSVAVARWAIEDGALVVPHPRVFAPFCVSDPGELYALRRLLTDRLIVTLDGPELTLTSTVLTVTLAESDTASVDTAQADAALGGWTWRLERIGDTPVPSRISSTLQFDRGNLAIEYACNQGGAEVTVTAMTITIGRVGSSEVGCSGDELAVETAVGRLLAPGAVVAYRIDGDTLTLTGETTELVYRATPDR